MNFTVEETNLMCIYGTESRTGLIQELTEMQAYIGDDEIELKELTESVLEKLIDISNHDFENIKEELVADFE